MPDVETVQPPIKQTLLEGGHFGCLPSVALGYLTDRLSLYGSTVSQDHRTALQGLMWLASEIAQGRLTGRYRFALPCGMGKTTGVRAFLRTVAQLGLPFRVTVACSKVSQLCQLKRKLIDEDEVSRHLIGLIHSYPVDRDRAEADSGYASEPSEGEDRQFLLVTHARCRVDDAGKARSWVAGREEDLVFYDESLVVGEALTLPLLNDRGDSLASEAAGFAETATVNTAHRAASGWTSASVSALKAATEGATGDDVRLVDLPPITEDEALSYLSLWPMVSERYPGLVSLIKQARDGVGFRVFVDRSSSRSLVSYSVSVPSALRNVIVLDASDPVRELVHHDPRMKRAEEVVPCLSKFKDIPGGVSSIKRYDQVHVYFANDPAGRSAMRGQFAQGPSSPLLQKFVRMVKAAPFSKVLAVTFKAKGKDDVQYTKRLREAVEAAGISPYEGLGMDGAKCGRLNLLTWGMETATNEYESCDVVAMLGVIHQRTDTIAGQYLGQVDDIRAPGVAGLVQRLLKAECVHSIYQAANRGSMRRTEVIDGVSQAAPCSVFIVHSDPDLRSKIERVLPGAKWLPWREEGEELKANEVALRIRHALETLRAEGCRAVTSRNLKARIGQTIPASTWKRGRDLAIEAVGWVVRGHSLVNLSETA